MAGGRHILIGVLLAPALVFALWAFGALWYDFPLGPPLPGILFLVLLVLTWRSAPKGIGSLLAVGGACGLVLAWWLTLRPSNDRAWQPDVARTAHVERAGDTVTIHNVRDFDYRADGSIGVRWIKRDLSLSALTGASIFINYWGSEWMAHPIVSFEFSDSRPISFSIETRKEVGEGYSAIGGLYRQYELIAIAAEERDVIRVRTSFREGETVHLYRTTLGPKAARERFLEYLHTLDDLHRAPRWYNAIETNCTTAIRSQHPRAERQPWDWRILLNGKMDALLFERGAFVTEGLDFPTLRRFALVDPATLDPSDPAAFSESLRRGRVGFSE